jgi:integrase
MPAAQGTIKQRSSDSLSIIATYRDLDTDQWKQKWQTVKRRPGETDRALRTRAEQELQELIVKLRRGETDSSGRLLLADFITHEWLPSIRLHITERTARGYKALLERHVLPALGKKQLKNVRPADIERIYIRMAEQGLSGTTRLHVHRVLAEVLSEAVRRGKLVSNPCSRERMRAPRQQPHTIHPPTPQEVGRLIKAAEGTRIEALLPLLAYTGLRVGEALGLRWQDVDLDAELLHVRQVRKQREEKDYGLPKTDRSRRTVDLAPALVTALRKHREKQFAFYLEHGFVPTHDLVFTEVSREGVVGMTHDNVAATWKRVRKMANVPNVRLHDLRHFAATTMIDAGVPLTNVSEILGHGQTSTTANIYAHAVRSRGAAAVAEIEKALCGT